MTDAEAPRGAPQFSADGRWWWDGGAWLPADRAKGVAEAFASGPPLPPLDAAETRKLLLWDPWGPSRLVWAHVRRSPRVTAVSGEPRAMTRRAGRLALGYVGLSLALPVLVVLVSWLVSVLRG